MVLVMASFAMPTPLARIALLVINVSVHAETAGEGMEPTVLVSYEKLGFVVSQLRTVDFNHSSRHF